MKKNFKFSLPLISFLVLIFFSTSIYAMSLPNRVLPFMSRGQDVVEVQKALNNIGMKLSVDGIYGNNTKNAVLSFQKRYSSLKNDGIYGPATKAVLEKALKGESDGNDGNKNPETPSEKVAYLTFDDGPSANVTARILKTLNDYDIKATFLSYILYAWKYG